MDYNLKHTFVEIETKDYIKAYRNVDKFIAFCEKCNRYCTCWACPPFDFNTDDYISAYKYAYILGTKIIFSQNFAGSVYTAEELKDISYRAIAEVREELDLLLLDIEEKYTGSKAFFAGTCHLCPDEDCTRKAGLPCRYPDKIRPSLEAVGFDMGKTSAELLDIEMKWAEGNKLPEYYTLVSGLFTNKKITGLTI